MPAALVPEIYVSDLAISLAFYCDHLGFEIDYERPEEKFAYIKRDSVEMMLEEPIGRTWLSAALEKPFGRGINFQIRIEDVRALYIGCKTANLKIFLDLETKAYRRRDDIVSQTQFIVQDPDGYLLRFAQTEAHAD